MKYDNNIDIDDKNTYNDTNRKIRMDGNDAESLKEKTVVVYGADKTTELILQTVANACNQWNNYADSNGPTIAMGIDQLRKGMKHAYERGIKIRYISEITKHNINYCKELMKIAELRHMDNAKGGMAVSEREYIATAKLQEARPVAHLIHSNVKEIVEQQQFIFQSLWVNAIPASQRIKEIENGYERIETRVLDDAEDINNRIKSLSKNSDEILICSDAVLLKIVHNSFFSFYREIMDKYEKGCHEGVRWITNINSKEDVDLTKLFMDIGIKIRSVKNLPPLNFLVTDKVFLSNPEEKDRKDDRKTIKNMFASNDKLYINHYKTLFEDLWKNAIDAIDAIDDIERGFTTKMVDVICRSTNAEETYLGLLQSAKNEIMLMLPTTNALLRQHKIGIFDSIIHAATHRNVIVKVLVPKSKKTEKFVEMLEKYEYSIGNTYYNSGNLKIRFIQTMLDARSTILIVDKKVSLVMELKDDTKEKFHEAIGLSTYSNSKPGVLSFVSIFENLWEQTELYQQLKKNEILREDFIRIAAHELRNPIQPILSISEILKQIINKNESEISQQVIVDRTEINYYIDSIIRNSKKLISLTKNVLDITSIEMDSLRLHKETVDLRMFLLEHMMDYEKQIKNDIEGKYAQNASKDERSKILLDYSQLRESGRHDSFLTEMDRSRISQVVLNLLNNAFKFTSEGDTISVEIKKEILSSQEYAVITIKDTGRGIHMEILPKLFTKFATKSDNDGTGLGLYICKSIVEAHGGRIWAKNNKDGKGAIFSFSIPLQFHQ